MAAEDSIEQSPAYLPMPEQDFASRPVNVVVYVSLWSRIFGIPASSGPEMVRYSFIRDGRPYGLQEKISLQDWNAFSHAILEVMRSTDQLVRAAKKMVVFALMLAFFFLTEKVSSNVAWLYWLVYIGFYVSAISLFLMEYRWDMFHVQDHLNPALEQVMERFRSRFEAQGFRVEFGTSPAFANCMVLYGYFSFIPLNTASGTRLT